MNSSEKEINTITRGQNDDVQANRLSKGIVIRPDFRITVWCKDVIVRNFQNNIHIPVKENGDNQ